MNSGPYEQDSSPAGEWSGWGCIPVASGTIRVAQSMEAGLYGSCQRLREREGLIAGTWGASASLLGLQAVCCGGRALRV